MKTKGIINACPENCIILLLLMLSSAFASFSQTNYTYLKNISLTGPGKNIQAGFQEFYAFQNSAAPGPVFASMTYFSSSPEKNGNANKETGILNPHDSNNSLSLTRINIDPYRVNREIIFRPTSFTYPLNSGRDVGIAEYSAEQLMLYAKALKQYAKRNGFDTCFAFLCNMGMLCNKKRFFVVNLVTMEIEESGLVSQGRGQGASVYDKQYSDEFDSKCTSLGRYKICVKYKGNYGQAYKLAGLDSSNKNVYSRNIVLHSMGCIPDKAGMMPACVSEGCPAVSPKFLSYLDKIISSRKNPVLLWIFDSNLEEVVLQEETSENLAAIDPAVVHEQRDYAAAITGFTRKKASNNAALKARMVYKTNKRRIIAKTSRRKKMNNKKPPNVLFHFPW